MKKKKSFGLFLTVLPLYLFTLCFVLGPLLYMIALSFATRGDGSSVVWNFTLITTGKSENRSIFKALYSPFSWLLPAQG